LSPFARRSSASPTCALGSPASDEPRLTSQRQRFDDTANQLARSALVLASFGGLGFFLTIVWQLSIAAAFGTSEEMDAFWIGVALPKAIVDSFHLGILTLLFIVVFNLPGDADSDDARWQLASSFLNLVVLFSLCAILLLQLGAPFLTKWMGPGLAPEFQSLSAQMLRRLSLMLVPTAFVGTLAGILHAHQNFLPFAMARSLGLTTQILLLFLLAGRIGVDALVWAMLIGASVMLPVCWLALRPSGLRYKTTLRFPDSRARAVLKMFATLTVIASFDRLNQISDRLFASLLGAGQVSSLEYAWRFEIPVSQILALSVALPAFAFMALQASEKRFAEFRKTLVISVRLIALLVIPVVGFLVVMRGPVTTAWFRRGEFSVEAATQVSSLIPFLAVIFLTKAFATVMVFGFLSLHQWRPLVGILLLEVLTNTSLNMILVEAWGLQGIVCATAAAMIGANLWLWARLVKAIGGWSLPSLASATWKPVGVSLCSVFLLRVLYLMFQARQWTCGEERPLLQLAAFGVVYLGVHFLLSYLFGLVEVGREGGLSPVRLRMEEWSPMSMTTDESRER
jgi:murein biosynthesis integral membrane protein MurJ